MSALLKTATAPASRDCISFGPYAELRDGMGRGPLEGVLMKFTFGNFSLVPPGIPHVDRKNDAQMDLGHRLQALSGGDTEGARVGRERDGRVDTGEQLIKVQRTPVHAAALRRGLANKGYHLSDLHWFKKEPRDDAKGQKEPSYVVVARFSNTDAPLKMDSATQDALRALARETWDNVYGWDNPNGIATINFVFRKPGMKPRMALVVRDDALRAIPVSGALAEQDE